MQLRTSILQAAANGFIQGTLNTGLSAAVASQGYKIDSITIEYPAFVTAAAGVITSQEVAISRASKAAMPLLTDDDVLIKDKHQFLLQTAIGQNMLPGIVELVPDNDIVIIEEQIYVSYKTANANAAYAVIIVIDVSTTKVTTDERIAILQSRLN